MKIYWEGVCRDKGVCARDRGGGMEVHRGAELEVRTLFYCFIDRGRDRGRDRE